MLLYLLLLFFFTNVVKHTIDTNLILMNEIVFSFVTCLIMLSGFFLSYIISSIDIAFGTFGIAVSVLLIKLNYYYRTCGTKTLYILYIVLLLSIIQGLLNQYKFDIVVQYISFGGVIVLIADPLKYIKLLMTPKNINDSICSLFIKDIVYGLSNIVEIIKNIGLIIFCFMYLKNVPDVWSSILVFIINILIGIFRLVDIIVYNPSINQTIKNIIPRYY
jgi:hypothetical protein